MQCVDVGTGGAEKLLIPSFLHNENILHRTRQEPPGECGRICVVSFVGPRVEQFNSMSTAASFLFFLILMHLPQKPYSCLSLWKSCGRREKVHTSVSVCSWMALSSLVFLSVRGKRSTDYIFVIFPPWIAVACVCVFLFFFCVNIGFSFLLLLLNGSVGEKKKVTCSVTSHQTSRVLFRNVCTMMHKSSVWNTQSMTWNQTVVSQYL